MGGDHKCPLCSATFTRPQHVGRHLRAHTGDRPYECKECPLRFARSDLLSRHVNKAHRAPEEGGAVPKKEGKKGRRKSMASLESNGAGLPGKEVGSSGRRASVSVDHSSRLANSSTDVTPVINSTPQLQASKMYPHHPLLANSPQVRPNPLWSTLDLQPMYNNNMSMSNPYNTVTSSYNNLFSATPMRQTGSEQGMNTLNRNNNPNNWANYDFGFKKKACDQCNHSKVRCDFADPCARCAHRHILCTYNKPSKSRSIAQSLPFGSRLGVFDSSASPVSTTSPQSQLTSSPINKSPGAFPLPANEPRRQSISMGMTHSAIGSGYNTYPPSQTISMGNNQIMSQPMWTQSMSDLGATLDPNMPAPVNMPITVTQHEDPYANVLLGLQPRKPSISLAQPLYAGVMQQTLSSSPAQTLAPTPALTNESRSPTGTSEPSERRSSRGSQLNNPVDTSNAMASSATAGPSTAYSQPQRSSLDLGMNAMQPTLGADGTFTWMPTPTLVDPRLQFRNSTNVGLDEDSMSVPGSSAASVYLEPLNENAMQNLSARRGSAGSWANQFNSMTLQDANGMTTSVSVNALTDPYSANQVVQSLSARRPTFPMTLQTADGSASTKIPSMADVKDLWKLFMTDPTGPTPSVEKSNPALVTPRPDISRTMSRRNSMPDLNSPTHSATISNFFSLNGTTPRPAEGQSSYIPPQVPADTHTPVRPDASIRKWTEEINQRQASFTMQPGVKMGGKNNSSNGTAGGSAAMPPPNFSGYPDMNMPMITNNRPLASVLQLNPALYQTLAPERAPSYGFGQSFEDGIPTLKVNNTPSPEGLAYGSNTAPTKFGGSNLSGPVINSVSNLGADATDSAMPNLSARPGNKRLSSQTLINDGKKSFSLYGGGDEITAEEDENTLDPSGLGLWGGVGVGVGAGIPVHNT